MWDLGHYCRDDSSQLYINIEFILVNLCIQQIKLRGMYDFMYRSQEKRTPDKYSSTWEYRYQFSLCKRRSLSVRDGAIFNIWIFAEAKKAGCCNFTNRWESTSAILTGDFCWWMYAECGSKCMLKIEWIFKSQNKYYFSNHLWSEVAIKSSLMCQFHPIFCNYFIKPVLKTHIFNLQY